jgi:hypothetical protein
MILSEQYYCVKRHDFATFGKWRNAASQKFPRAPLTVSSHSRRTLGPIRRHSQRNHRMEKTLFALSLGFAGLILATHAGWAGQQCAPRDQIIAVLAQSYGEARAGIGLNGADRVMEVFVNAKTGTWTITVTLPDGQTCLVATGEHFESLAEGAPPKGDPA